MLNRRTFGIGLASAMSGATPALSHHTGAKKSKTWVVPEEFKPRIVEMDEDTPPGEIHVDPNFYALYLTLPGALAWRYTVAVSRPELWEPGEYYVKWKTEWPRWRPTNSMIERNPSYAKYKNGMPGGPRNPLGARALYLFDGDRDTYLRIHGTTKPWTIGQAVSNGCARMVNEHVIHLYDRPLAGRSERLSAHLTSQFSNSRYFSSHHGLRVCRTGDKLPEILMLPGGTQT